MHTSHPQPRTRSDRSLLYDSPSVHAHRPTRLPDLLALGVHELRTPVTVAAGYLRMLLQGRSGDLTSGQRTLVEKAERPVARIDALHITAQASVRGKSDRSRVLVECPVRA